jgi:N-acyl-D-amino-acid deacylase
MRLRTLLPASLVALGAVLVANRPGPAQQQQTFDLLIVGGRVLDGTGNPWMYADVGVINGRIAAVGPLKGRQARRTIDATGKYVSPGFIDPHSHADDGSSARGGFRDPNPQYRAAPNLITQGITTVVVNHDGRSPLPIKDQRDFIEKNGIGPNTMLMVGHGTVRGQVMGGDTRRPARPDEITRMRAIVKEAMEQGAIGLSAGLEYAPGRWSTTDEVVELAREIVPFRGVYISHERSEGSDPLWYVPSRDPAGPPSLLDAVRETIEIGERTGARVVASHIKAKGANYWGSSGAAIQLIEAARQRGVDVWADQYPYPTSGTDGSTVLIPDWAVSGGGGARGGGGGGAAAAAAGAGGRGGGGRGAAAVAGDTAGGRGRAGGGGAGGRGGAGGVDRAAALQQTLADTALARQLRSDIAHEIARRGGASNVVIFDYPDSALYGKSIADVAAMWKLDPVETAIQIQMRGNRSRAGGARMRGFSMSEIDMEAFIKQPWVATSTDAGIALPTEGPSTHARFYGSYPRKIRHYVIDRGAITLEQAIRSSTSLPAMILGLKDRGLIREGNAADLVVFDLTTIRDKSTFFQPHQYSEGIDYVFVNGEAVVDGGKITWKLPGKVLLNR